MIDMRLFCELLEAKESLTEEELKQFNMAKLIVERQKIDKDYQEKINNINSKMNELLKDDKE